jgi:hypothetical protein
MPRYYFHLHHNGVRFADEEGQDLASVAEAHQTAKALAVDLMNDPFDGARPWLASHFEVTDEAGRTVLKLSFLNALETRTDSD